MFARTLQCRTVRKAASSRVSLVATGPHTRIAEASVAAPTSTWAIVGLGATAATLGSLAARQWQGTESPPTIDDEVAVKEFLHKSRRVQSRVVDAASAEQVFTCADVKKMCSEGKIVVAYQGESYSLVHAPGSTHSGLDLRCLKGPIERASPHCIEGLSPG